MRRVRVAVVGAGPAGSALALLLARAGVAVLVIEAAAWPRDKPCGEAFGPGVSRFLSSHGIARPARSLPLTGIRLSAGGVAAAIPYRAADSSVTGFAARRRDLDQVLLAAALAAGAELLAPARVLAVDAARLGAVTLAVRHHGRDRAVAADLAAGAGGLGCPVARALGGRRRRHGRIAILRHLDGVAGLGAEGEAHLVGRGFVGIAPLAPGHANVAAVLDTADLGGGHRPEQLWQRAIDAAGLAPRLAAAMPAGAIRVTGPLAFHPGRLCQGGGFLIGDAAGFVDPFTGDGVALALQGAALAAPAALAALNGGGESALAAYARAHHRAFAGRLRLDRALRALARHPRLANRLVAALAGDLGRAERVLAVPADLAPARSLLSPALLLPLLARALQV